ncbi:MAPEG family protein [Cognatiyoonia sp. IB215446]|uniref:MAPEG family protein n=1 Tax=Cognatiyoonia sp. IB215446 TaxID=3097355 RepID=UPI002A0D3596|nr:MAPEG family protein [Cognatiyoonia sp. IB215446]MDX8348253.1 MAPEG family protein [Cognatiyoonia sp. IB215446]
MESFPTELGILTCLGILAASLWIPYIIGVNTSEAGSPADIDSQDFSRPANPALQRPWVHRAYRAHLNLLEQFVPFAFLVLLVDRVDGFTALTYWTAIAFFWLRVAHAIGYITGWARLPARPIIFTLGWVCCLIMAYAVFAAAL